MVNITENSQKESQTEPGSCRTQPEQVDLAEVEERIVEEVTKVGESRKDLGPKSGFSLNSFTRGLYAPEYLREIGRVIRTTPESIKRTIEEMWSSVDPPDYDLGPENRTHPEPIRECRSEDFESEIDTKHSEE